MAMAGNTLVFGKDFNSRVQRLMSMKLNNFYEVRRKVEAIQATVNTIITAKKCRLTRHESLKTMAAQFSDKAYCENVVQILSEELPVLEPIDYLEEGSYVLIADTVGMNGWNEEQIYELVNSPDAYDQEYSLTAFLELICYGIDNEESWSSCREYFGWPTPTHYCIHTYGNNLNHRFIKRTLKKAGAPPEVYTMVMLTLFPPENQLLTTTADDWESDPSCMEVQITPENIRQLRKDWRQAKPLVAQIRPAMEWAKENPWIIPILGECLENSQPDRKERVRVRV